ETETLLEKQPSAALPTIVKSEVLRAQGDVEAAYEVLDDYDAPVVFVTAFPERLLTGDRPEPTYLITKPFLPDALKATISQALFFHGAEGAN
ncbi:MAG: response regulator, partial [Maricaulaceae bacterium]